MESWQSRVDHCIVLTITALSAIILSYPYLISVSIFGHTQAYTRLGIDAKCLLSISFHNNVYKVFMCII